MLKTEEETVSVEQGNLTERNRREKKQPRKEESGHKELSFRVPRRVFEERIAVGCRVCGLGQHEEIRGAGQLLGITEATQQTLAEQAPHL